jgi:hypothetical protein
MVILPAIDQQQIIPEFRKSMSRWRRNWFYASNYLPQVTDFDEFEIPQLNKTRKKYATAT